MLESIHSCLVGSADFTVHTHHVDNPCCCRDIDDFHYIIVERVETCEKIQVPTDKDYQEDLLRLDREAFRTLVLEQALQNQEYSNEVTHVTCETKDVHRHGGVWVPILCDGMAKGNLIPVHD